MMNPRQKEVYETYLERKKAAENQSQTSLVE